ncbi:MAG: hypothetical protein HN350_22220, partial [Phycisphaerales bacterium]|nr:hypothetical protein [Phycisphaerales bacterium]
TTIRSREYELDRPDHREVSDGGRLQRQRQKLPAAQVQVYTSTGQAGNLTATYGNIAHAGDEQVQRDS